MPYYYVTKEKKKKATKSGFSNPMRQVEIAYIPQGWIHKLYFATYTRKMRTQNAAR